MITPRGVWRWALSWKDRRHFEIAAGPLRISRWCTDRPCRQSSPHPLMAVRVVARWTQQ